jgi:hypothetical protein
VIVQEDEEIKVVSLCKNNKGGMTKRSNCILGKQKKKMRNPVLVKVPLETSENADEDENKSKEEYKTIKKWCDQELDGIVILTKEEMRNEVDT